MNTSISIRYKERHGQRSTRRGAVAALLTLCLTACTGTISRKDLELEPPPERSGFPVAWRPAAAVEPLFPSVGAVAGDEQEANGDAFLRKHAKIDARVLSLLHEIVLVESNARGLFGAMSFKLSPSKSPESVGVYILNIKRARPNFEEELTLTLDGGFRLARYEGRRAFLFRGGVQPSTVVAKWSETTEEGRTHKGYIVRTDLDAKDLFVACEKRHVPEEVLPLFALLAPESAMLADFPVMSCVHKAVYGARFEVRPAPASVAPEQRGAADALVMARSRSPLGDSWQLGVAFRPIPGIRFGSISGDMRVYPASGADFEFVRRVGRLARAEKNRMLFAPPHLFARYTGEGIDLKDEMDRADDKRRDELVAAAFSRSWFGLDLGSLALNFAGRLDLSFGQLQTMTNIEGGGALSGAPQGGQLVLTPGQRFLSIGIDVLPPEMSLESFGNATLAALLEGANVGGVRLQRLGKGGDAPVRIDLELLPKAPRTAEARPGADEAVYVSLVLLTRGNVVMRVEYYASGKKSLDWWKALDAMNASIHMDMPPLNLDE